MYIIECMYVYAPIYIYTHVHINVRGRQYSPVHIAIYTHECIYLYMLVYCYTKVGEVGGWGRDPKKCTGRDWGMGSSTI